MEERLVQIIREEVADFINTLDSHLEDSEERLNNKIDFIKKTYGSIPKDRPEEKKMRDAERKDAEAELKDVKDMEKEMEDKAAELEKAEKEAGSEITNSNILNSPSTQTTTTAITGSI